jgi:hypothetical protein
MPPVKNSHCGAEVHAKTADGSGNPVRFFTKLALKM